MPEWKKNLVKDRIKNSIILKKVQKSENVTYLFKITLWYSLFDPQAISKV
ncbi:MAG: hypothetical protein HLUCCX10_07320 [Algoriphagus marincola HL-49]|uniref:Uncharacterized protein n=1 Tax=Algoriphagus marincola HL-49 TaxID=1305737 RepID=A0A0P7YA16_9BACT|nr:MAG: hypothetical protein HLUCCX10_07320 [Algoriphagus marincola HL-49]